ncbi:hypothetical protein [Streptomyces sp. NBC_00094]|uniref:hypothetical protein n=1 Tax=Streptomyces sp. NBC_00094 TaxID=2903620 RepID=UPI002250A85F|nr:hypothetical protein [Streptomyces sp. NBC_00094]MCX5392717.1 hypothetical protein [Streptomyces sp. NBC_00094]
MVVRADIGKPVRDHAGRVGILRDVIRDYEDPADMPGERRRRPTAFVWPEGGGREWLVPPDTVTRI